jgi:hypothetical protein
MGKERHNNDSWNDDTLTPKGATETLNYPTDL